MRPLRAFVLMALLGWFGVWMTNGPVASAPAQRPVVVTVPATTTTIAPTTTSTTARLRIAAPRASRGATRPRPSLDDATRQRVIDAIYAYSDWDAARMVRIGQCESGLNPWAVNGSHHNVFQIVGATLGLIEEHVALAHSMWQHRGYQPWQCKG